MQDQGPVTPDYDLGHYLRPLKRHRAVLIFFVLVGLVGGLAYAVLSGTNYTSAAQLNVSAAPALPGQAVSVNPANGRTNGAVNLDTESQVVKSTVVIERALSALHSTTTVAALRKRLDVTVPANSQVLRIACSARSPKAAQSCATAVANAYFADRTATEQATVDRAIAATKRQRTLVESQITRDAAAIAASQPNTQARNNAFALQQSDSSNRNQLNNQLDQLATADVSPGIVIDPAPPGVAGGANRAIPPLTGLIVGLIIGVAIVYGRERYDRFVRHADDLSNAGVALIAEIKPAQGRATSNRLRTERVARTRFDQRLASVVAGSFDADGGVIYVANVSPDQHGDNVADRLGSTLASVGHSVEIVRPTTVEVVANRPAPTPHALEAPNGDGPSADAGPSEDLVTGLLGWPDQPRESPSREVAVTTPAAIAPEVIEAAADSIPMSIRVRLETARRRAQFVIIDGDPAVTDAQAYILAGLSDASLLTVDPDATTRLDLAEVVDQISVTGSHLIGAVIWRPARKRPRDGATSDADAENSGSGGRHVRTRHRESEGTPGTGTPSTEPGSTPHRPVDAAR